MPPNTALCEATLPSAIAELVDALAGMPGTVAVVLGGSRAMGEGDATSDWDMGVYYRGGLDTGALERRGTVYPPGSWGRVMNGGAWLSLDSVKVDVLLRDLDVVEHWSSRAAEGVFEVDALLGYVAGVPTYSLLAERSVAKVLAGSLPAAGDFPEALARAGRDRWSFASRFSLMHARMRAARGDLLGTLGSSAKAVIEQAHALLCDRRTWVLNEKRIVERAGLGAMQGLFAEAPHDPAALLAWTDVLERALAPVDET